MSIENKVVLITGASSGLGEATARHLAERGAKLALAARRQDKLETIAEDLRAKGTEVEVIQTDVTIAPRSRRWWTGTVERFGRMDVIVNNAGLMAIAPMDEAKVDEWDKMIDINIKGVLYGIASALPCSASSSRGISSTCPRSRGSRSSHRAAPSIPGRNTRSARSPTACAPRLAETSARPASSRAPWIRN